MCQVLEACLVFARDPSFQAVLERQLFLKAMELFACELTVVMWEPLFTKADRVSVP